MSFKWNPGEGDHDATWDVYFMAIALLSEKKSKDKVRQVGACIVDNEPRVIGIGYNGMPINCHDDLMPWDEKDAETKEKLKHQYVCHAELNAIVNMDPKSVSGYTLYVTLFPCNECAKMVKKSGIKRVIYLSDEKGQKEEFRASKMILKEAGISYKSFAEIGVDIPDYGGRSDLPEEERPIRWKHYFMLLATLSAEYRSRPDSKEGACVVNEDRRVVGLGYVRDEMSGKDEIGEIKRSRFVSHAPVNAIVSRSPSSLRNCTMYATHYPCNECAKVIVQSGIRKVIYMNASQNKEVGDATARMFAIAHIKLKKCRKEPGSITLDFLKYKHSGDNAAAESSTNEEGK